MIGRCLEGGDLGPTHEAHRVDDAEDRRALTFVAPSRTLTAAELFEFLQKFRKRFPIPHPGIALVEQVRPGGRHPFFCSRFLPTGTLADWETERPDRETVLEAIRSLALAVEFLHGVGLGRLPLAPSEVLLGDDGRPRLHEYLLARQVLLRERSAPRPEAGRAPADEAASGRRTRDGAQVDDPVVVDLFALGRLLVLGLTGRRVTPHGGLTGLLALLDRPESADLDGIDTEAASLVRRSLAIDEAGRYPTAAALAGDLQHLLRHRRLPAARPPARPGRFRRPLGVALLGLLVVASAFVLARLAPLADDPPGEDATASDLARAARTPFDRLLGGDLPEDDATAPADDGERDRYAAGLDEALVAQGPRQVSLFVEGHLHHEFVAEETVRVFEGRLATAGEAVRLVLTEMTADVFDELMRPLAEASDPTASRALEIVGQLLLQRANRHLLQAIATRPVADWSGRVWETYQVINGPGRTNQLRQDLESLPPAVADRVRLVLREAGLDGE